MAFTINITFSEYAKRCILNGPGKSPENPFIREGDDIYLLYDRMEVEPYYGGDMNMRFLWGREIVFEYTWPKPLLGQVQHIPLQGRQLVKLT